MPIPFRDFILLLITISLWAGYYVAGKWSLEIFPPLFLTALRFVVVVIALLPWMIREKRAFSYQRLMVFAFLLGVLNFGFGLASLGWGLDMATAIVVGQMAVPFSCMFGAMMLNDSLGPWRSFGLLVAMLGAVTIAGTPNVSSNFAAFLALLAACAGWGLSNILLKRWGEVKIYPFLGWISLFACIQLLVLSAMLETGQIAALHAAGFREWGGVIYLGLGSTVVAYGLWYYLLNKHVASQITPFTMLGPFIAYGLGKIFFDEPVTAQVLVAGAITMTGVAIIVMRRPRLAMLGKVKLKSRKDAP